MDRWSFCGRGKLSLFAVSVPGNARRKTILHVQGIFHSLESGKIDILKKRKAKLKL